MNTQYSAGCNKKTILFDNQNVLASAVNKLMAMKSNWSPEVITKAGTSNLKFKKEKGEVKEGLIIMIEVDSKALITQVVKTDSWDCLIEVDLNIDRTSRGMSGKETLE